MSSEAEVSSYQPADAVKDLPQLSQQQQPQSSTWNSGQGNKELNVAEALTVVSSSVDTAADLTSVQDLCFSVSWSESPDIKQDSGQGPVMTKPERAEFKTDFLSRIKQEIQIRDLLMRKQTFDLTSRKTGPPMSRESPVDVKTLGSQVLAAAKPASENPAQEAEEVSARVKAENTEQRLQPDQDAARSECSQLSMQPDQDAARSECSQLSMQPDQDAARSECSQLSMQPDQDAARLECSQLSMQSDQDVTGKTRKIRHKKRVSGNKICLVCGDKALAHNFNVITCESCKAFFRRNALKGQNLQRCMFEKNCTIDKNTRRFCPSCRLRKCFDIGMKAELMLDEVERRLRQEKKAQRILQQADTSSTAADEAAEAQVGSSGTRYFELDSPFSPDTGNIAHNSSYSPHDLPPATDLTQSSLSSSALPSFHTLRDPMSQSFRQSLLQEVWSAVNPQSTFSSLRSQLSGPSMSDVTSSQSPDFTQQNVMSQAASTLAGDSSIYATSFIDSSAQHHQHEQERQHQQEVEQRNLMPENCPLPLLPGPAARIFKHVPRDQLPSDPFMYWMLSEDERLVLSNLTMAYQDVLLSLKERGLFRNVSISDSYFINDFLNEIDDAMYKIVQFSKHITDFRMVRKEDQIALLKSSAMQSLGIACCATYIHERDCWLSLRGDLTLSHLRKLTNDDPYVQVGVHYCRSMKSLVKNDFTIYALVHCMILFDPRDAKIVDRQIINQTRDKYVIMLKHYLESQYSYLFADEYFVAIQDRVREMCHLAQTGNELFKRYSSAFQPLITEMLSAS